MTHSSADLLLAGWTIRLALRAPAASLGGMLASEVSWSISTSVAQVGACPVTIINPALSSAFASVVSRTAGGHWLELAIVQCCIASALLALSVMRLTISAISKSEVGTQSESVRAKFTVGKTHET